MTGDDRDRDRDPSFAEHMRGQRDVEPLPPPNTAPPSSKPAATRPVRHRPAAAEAFRFPDEDDPLLAHRPSLSRRQLADLRAGRIRPERRIDLHRLDRAAAERVVRRAVLQAAAAGARCVLVITGRGRHSEHGEPVLRDRLRDWLTCEPVASCVAAFTPAATRDGGRGAFYVLLR